MAPGFKVVGSNKRKGKSATLLWGVEKRREVSSDAYVYKSYEPMQNKKEKDETKRLPAVPRDVEEKDVTAFTGVV